MGSVFVTQEDRTIRGFGGKKYKVPFYLQFVHGFTVDVCHSAECLSYGGEHTLNTIIALPHISDKLYKKKSLAIGNEDHRYYPLLRGINDVPTKGDPVLLCTIGKTNYYLGPLNTTNNSPTWNNDENYTPELSINEPGINKYFTNQRGARGESFTFNKEVPFKRLIKYRKDELDFGDSSLIDTTGDTIIEGRHGNSLRIGSRNISPYLFISNGRHPKNQVESLIDGSLISITSKGTLAQHFEGYTKPGTETERVNLKTLSVPEDDSNEESVLGFTLASDTLEEPNMFMGDIISSVNNNGDIQELIYDYNDNQMLFHSDRITLNTKTDDIYLSSIKDIHIGTGRHLTISANEDLIIKSNRLFLGTTYTGESENKEDTSEPMIMGQTLLELLKETLDVIKNSQGICQGAPIALADETGAPGTVNAKITNIENKIETILSTKYYIEKNE